MDTGSYSSYSALQGPLILIAVSVHQQPVAILAVLVLIHLLAATSFGSKLLTSSVVSPRTSCPGSLPPPLQPAITFFVPAPASLITRGAGGGVLHLGTGAGNNRAAADWMIVL